MGISVVTKWGYQSQKGGDIIHNKVGISVITRWALGWVNFYQKFKIEKYSVCGKLILPKKWKSIYKKKTIFNTNGLQICMDLRIFASFLYQTLLKICSQKFDRK